MTVKAALILICIIFLAACQAKTETANVTRENTPAPTLTMTALALNTAVPPTPIPTTTSTLPPPTPTFTTTPVPTSTATPKPMFPTDSLLFVGDNKLKRWVPQSGEVTTVAENITGRIVYSGEIGVFVREFTPDQDYALVVFHIPTQSEVEIFRSVGRFDKSVSISPNDRWVAIVTGESRDSATLTVHEMVVENQQLAVSDPVLTITPAKGWNWPYDQLLWATENELSWSGDSGIWVADLSADSIEPVIAITPSTSNF